MKTPENRTLITASLIGLGLLLAGSASADRPDGAGSDRAKKAWASEQRPDFAKSDRSEKKGKARGKKHGHVRYKGKRFERADENGDGFLTQSEVGDRRWKRIVKADANADKKVSKEELDVAWKDRKAARGDRKMKRHDKNGDGFLTQNEVGDRHWQRIAKADANADKKVSKEELEARKDRKQARKHGARPDGKRRAERDKGRPEKAGRGRPDHAGRGRSASK